MASLGQVLHLAKPDEARAFVDVSRVLLTGTPSFFNNNTFSDVTIICPDGRELKCHQLVLASCSKRLASVFHARNFSGQRLPVQGVETDALQTVIQSFYTGECPLSLSTVVAIYDTALKLEVPGLGAACLEFISKFMKPVHACSMLISAMTIAEQRLVDLCVDRILAWFSDVIQTADFKELPPDVLVSILQQVPAPQRQQALVLQALSTWLTHSLEDRKHLLPNIMSVLGLTTDKMMTNQEPPALHGRASKPPLDATQSKHHGPLVHVPSVGLMQLLPSGHLQAVQVAVPAAALHGLEVGLQGDRLPNFLSNAASAGHQLLSAAGQPSGTKGHPEDSRAGFATDRPLPADRHTGHGDRHAASLRPGNSSRQNSGEEHAVSDIPASKRHGRRSSEKPAAPSSWDGADAGNAEPHAAGEKHRQLANGSSRKSAPDERLVPAELRQGSSSGSEGGAPSAFRPWLPKHTPSQSPAGSPKAPRDSDMAQTTDMQQMRPPSDHNAATEARRGRMTPNLEFAADAQPTRPKSTVDASNPPPAKRAKQSSYPHPPSPPPKYAHNSSHSREQLEALPTLTTKELAASLLPIPHITQLHAHADLLHEQEDAQPYKNSRLQADAVQPDLDAQLQDLQHGQQHFDGDQSGDDYHDQQQDEDMHEPQQATHVRLSGAEGHEQQQASLHATRQAAMDMHRVKMEQMDTDNGMAQLAGNEGDASDASQQGGDMAGADS